MSRAVITKGNMTQGKCEKRKEVLKEREKKELKLSIKTWSLSE
jgi:hypothetical protein